MTTIQFPGTLDACMIRDQAKWPVGDNLIAETDGSTHQLEKAAEWLAEQHLGFDYSVGTLRKWRTTSLAFPDGTRDLPVIFSVYEVMSTQSDPVQQIRNFVTECESKGVAPNRDRARKFVGQKSRGRIKVRSAIKNSDDPDIASTVAKDLVTENDEVAESLMNDPRTRDRLRRALKERDSSIVTEAAKEAKQDLTTGGLFETHESDPLAEARQIVEKSLEYSSRWVLATTELLEKDVHLSLTDEERSTWVKSIDEKVKRLRVLADVIRSGTAMNASDADLEAFLEGGVS